MRMPMRWQAVDRWQSGMHMAIAIANCNSRGGGNEVAIYSLFVVRVTQRIIQMFFFITNADPQFVWLPSCKKNFKVPPQIFGSISCIFHF